MAEFAFCESVTAGSKSRWHIRQLTDIGKKLGGGCDTPALCGRQVSWDVNCPVVYPSPVFEDGVCSTCAEVYKDEAH